MLEGTNPRHASDLRLCIPHPGSTQQAAQGHDCNKVASQCWRAAASARHHPELREPRNDTDVQARHPDGVEERAIVEVSMEQGRENNGAHNEREDPKTVLFGTILSDT